MTVPRGIRMVALDPAIAPSFWLQPPGWTRLEPQSVTGDPTPGVEARVHDPLWLLTRQWQLGEFAAEDTGSPVAVHVTPRSVTVDAWTPGADGAPRPLPPGTLLEPLVEAEPATAAGLRRRAEGGAELLAAFSDAGVDPEPVATALLAGFRLTAPLDRYDVSAPALLAALAGRVPDGDAIAASIALPALPEWLPASVDAATARSVLGDWLTWYRSWSAPQLDPGADCWSDEQLEYHFGLVAGGATLHAPAFGGGRVDWSDLDAQDASDPTADAVPAATQTMLATPLRYAGMPADRYWQFEDGQVNLGALQVQPHDLARLLLVEFATVYGNDWLVVPVDVPYGSFTTLTSVSYTTTFAEQIDVLPADDSSRSGRFRLFEVSVAGSDAALTGLFVPPSVAGVLEGPAQEDVLFLRDEHAAMAWAVERIVTGPSGEARNRHDEGYPSLPGPGDDPAAELDYVLQTDVPSWWIPFLPYSTGYATIALAKGAMLRDGVAVEPLGVLLRPNEPMAVRDEEIPREGVRVRRVPTLARHNDGSYVLWTTRRVGVGRGEGSSGLVFDATLARPAQGDP